MAVIFLREPRLVPDPDALNLCWPAGIGDAVWLYAKLRHLPGLTGVSVRVSMPDGEPRRGHQLLERLPAVTWAGYEPGWRNADLFARALRGEAGLEAFVPGEWLATEVNRWLERGRKLADWLPWLPIDYHFEIPVTPEERSRGDELLAGFRGQWLAMYVSNRDKERFPGWSLWTSEEWAQVGCATGMSVVLLGAEYDRDKTEEVASLLQRRGAKTRLCLGESLGTALHCLSRCRAFVAFPSGIGILANVLRVPGVMLLPKMLAGLAEAYADPEDLEAGRYRAWVTPSPDEVSEWMARLVRTTRTG